MNVLGWLLTGGIGLWLIQKSWSAVSKWRQRKRAENNVILFLEGLPQEVKAVVVNYKLQGCHTLRLDPLDHSVQYLIQTGVLRYCGAAGGYSAVNGFLALEKRIWPLLDRWAAEDPEFEVIAAVMTKEPGK